MRAALQQVEKQILADHVSHCVVGAIESGDEIDRRHKIDELVEAVGRMTR